MQVSETGWLLRDGEVLAAADAPGPLVARMVGFSRHDESETALLLRQTRFTHSVGVRGPMDVAFLDDELVVLGTVHLARWRVARPRRGGRHVLIVPGGAFERWGLAAGDRIEFRSVG